MLTLKLTPVKVIIKIKVLTKESNSAMRLTKAIKTQILSTIIEKKHPFKTIKDINEKQQKICAKVMNKTYPPHVKEWMEACPDGYTAFTMRSSFQVSIGSSYVKIHLAEKHHDTFYLPSRYVNIPAIPLLSSDAKTIDCVLNPDTPEAIEFLALEEERDVYYTAVKALKATVNKALSACNTKKQLEDLYPTLVPYVPKEEKKGKSLVITNKELEACLTKGKCQQ